MPVIRTISLLNLPPPPTHTHTCATYHPVVYRHVNSDLTESLENDRKFSVRMHNQYCAILGVNPWSNVRVSRGFQYSIRAKLCYYFEQWYLWQRDVTRWEMAQTIRTPRKDARHSWKRLFATKGVISRFFAYLISRACHFNAKIQNPRLLFPATLMYICNSPMCFKPPLQYHLISPSSAMAVYEYQHDYTVTWV